MNSESSLQPELEKAQVQVQEAQDQETELTELEN
jgi:hypothetical protein